MSTYAAKDKTHGKYKHPDMNIKDALLSYNFPPAILDLYEKDGITTLYPPQADALRQGLLDDQSFLISVPTAAGKTLLAELCMLKTIFSQKGRCLYIVPLKALASEKYESFKERFSSLGIQVGIATGDLDSPQKFLSRYQILVATAEKIDSLLRSRQPWLSNGLGCVVIDEIHFINDGSRGPTLEILIARLKQLNPGLKFLGLSATVKNAPEVAEWLKARLLLSAWRPVPLKEGIYCNEKIYFQHHGVKIIKEEPADDLSKITLDTLRGGGQVLVFVNSRRSAQASGKLLGPAIGALLSQEEHRQLALLADDILGPSHETTQICRKLAETVKNGVAFHHAGLRPRQRKLIEEHFKKNLIKVICSTPTLAAGVNLPARRAILRDYKRYEAGIGSAFIPTSEYKQCAGRAGRPQYDDFGEAVIMAKSFSESNTLFERYIAADPEPVMSKLNNASVLRTHILASIAGGYVHDINSMFEFLGHTFLSHQHQTRQMLELVSSIFDFLHQEGFIEKAGFRYLATTFGECISRLYIDPLTGIVLRNGLKKLVSGKSISSVGLLHLMCCCPDAGHLKLAKDDPAALEEFATTYEEDFLLTAKDLDSLEDYYTAMATLKTTLLLQRWIEEEKEDTLCEEFNIGPGDIHRHIEEILWLLHTAGVIAQLFNLKSLTFPIEDLRRRVQYGIREELLELVQLKGVGRVRARSLYTHGYTKLHQLRSLAEEELAQVETIGKALAKDIRQQLASAVKLKKSFISLAEEPEMPILP